MHKIAIIFIPFVSVAFADDMRRYAAEYLGTSNPDIGVLIGYVAMVLVIGAMVTLPSLWNFFSSGFDKPSISKLISNLLHVAAALVFVSILVMSVRPLIAGWTYIVPQLGIPINSISMELVKCLAVASGAACAYAVCIGLCSVPFVRERLRHAQSKRALQYMRASGVEGTVES